MFCRHKLCILVFLSSFYFEQSNKIDLLLPYIIPNNKE